VWACQHEMGLGAGRLARRDFDSHSLTGLAMTAGKQIRQRPCPTNCNRLRGLLDLLGLLTFGSWLWLAGWLAGWSGQPAWQVLACLLGWVGWFRFGNGKPSPSGFWFHAQGYDLILHLHSSFPAPSILMYWPRRRVGQDIMTNAFPCCCAVLCKFGHTTTSISPGWT
jgi:hypothetical protein